MITRRSPSTVGARTAWICTTSAERRFRTILITPLPFHLWRRTTMLRVRMKNHGVQLPAPGRKVELWQWILLAALLNAFFWFVITHV